MPSTATPPDAVSWPDFTLVIRGGVGDAADLERRRSIEGTWSVFAAPLTPLVHLAGSLPHKRLRTTTLGRVRAAGGWLRETPGPPFHCDLGGLTAIQLDAILGPPIENPVPAHERR